MKALTLRPHWAWLVVNGYKDIENRSWPTRLRSRVWIHASSSPVAQVEYQRFVDICRDRRIKKFPAREDFQTGGIVGSVEIVDCVTKSRSYWFSGEYGFVLGNARRTTFRPMKGMLGFFEVPSQPKPRKSTTKLPTNDYVAYHSTEMMGYDYTPAPGKFRFFSRKPRTYLEKTIGADVWAITGARGRDGKMVYRLAAVYTPDAVRDCHGGFQILGKRGEGFNPPIELNALPWFRRLLKEQNRFSSGFNRIWSDVVVAGLTESRALRHT